MLKKIAAGLAVAAVPSLALSAWGRRSGRDGSHDDYSTYDYNSYSSDYESDDYDDTPAWRRSRRGSVTATRYPRIQIDQEVLAQIHAYAQAAPGEITLLGASDYDERRNAFIIRRVFLPKQACTSSYTEVDPEGMAEVMLEAMTHDLTLNVWLHSHGSMAVFFSGTDVRNIESAFPQADRVVSIVVNRAGDMLARLTQFKPIRLEIDNVPITIGASSQVEQVIRDEVKAKVKQGYDRWDTYRRSRERERETDDHPLAAAGEAGGYSYAYRPTEADTRRASEVTHGPTAS
jgi:proteasome lid subunit RPN8/RPN11